MIGLASYQDLYVAACGRVLESYAHGVDHEHHCHDCWETLGEDRTPCNYDGIEERCSRPLPTLAEHYRVPVDEPMEEGVAILEEYGLEVRTINALEESGFLRIGDFAGLMLEELSELPRIGSNAARQIRESLRAFIDVQES